MKKIQKTNVTKDLDAISRMLIFKSLFEIKTTDTIETAIFTIHANLTLVESFQLSVARKPYYYFVCRGGMIIKLWKNGKKTEYSVTDLLSDIE